MTHNEECESIMDWFTGIIVFLLIWWLTIFAVLPFGIKRDKTGRPNDPKLKQKFLATTALSVLIWLLVYALIEADIISFREMAKSL